MESYIRCMATLWSMILCCLTASCVSVPSLADRTALAEDLAHQHHWHGQWLPAGRFALRTYLPDVLSLSDQLTVYIEGDGLAWISPTRPSIDPTPHDPLALRLALAHPDGNAAYLARPCQFIDARKTGCDPQYWMSSRFAPAVIESANLAIDQLKAMTGGRQLTLVGYSGGGAVALLVAARRHDVTRLVTVAGNLDHREWTAYHQVDPLRGSLDPADVIDTLAHIEQWHLVGGRDTVMPPSLAQRFIRRFPATSLPHLRIEPDFDHQCCWVPHWPALWRRIEAGRN